MKRKVRLSTAERARRSRHAKKVLLPSAIRATGRKGFTKTRRQLEGKMGIRSAKKLSGWLKGQAHKEGVLSPEHSYRRKRKNRR